MKKLLSIMLILGLCATAVFAAGGKEKGEEAPTFQGKNVRVVIGSTSTSGDSYLIAETVVRHLSKALGANMKVDAVGAGAALEAIRTAKPDGNTIMIFHDMTYLGVSFKAYDEMYKLENMIVGPRAVQNPGAAWAAGINAPYNSMKEIPEYLKANPNKISRFALEAGGVSHIGFIAYYEWVRVKYGSDVAKRIVVILGGSTADKCQLLWDGNCDVIFADYTSLLDYTKTTDKKIAMKYVGLLDNIKDLSVPSYADQRITLANGKDFRFSKDFLFYLPKDFPPALIAELDKAMKAISGEGALEADLAKMRYRTAYLNSADAQKFIYGKRADLQGLIDSAPSLDDLVK